jgi:transcriptional regulator with XRE-family HTH domain
MQPRKDLVMEPFKRLDEAMNRRRLELRMNWRQVAEAAGISYTAIRAIRRGDYQPTELTARGIDDALRWVHGSVLAVLAGGEPTPIEAQAAEAARRAALREEATAAAAESTLPLRDIELVEELALSAAEKVGLSPEHAREAFRRALTRIERKRMTDEQGQEREESPEIPRRRRTG